MSSQGTTILNATVVSPTGVVRAPLHIVGERVVAAAPRGALEIDLRDHLVFPGLVNAHDHLQINSILSPSPARPFLNSYDWAGALQPYLATARMVAARRVPEATRHWHGGLKNLLCGATTVAHHDPWHRVLDEPAFPVNLLRSFGWCHSLGLAPRDEPARDGVEWLTWTLAQAGRRALRTLVSHIDRKRGMPRLQRVGSYGPAARASFAATPRDRPWMIHLAEGIDETAGEELGQLDGLGCLAANTVLVHGVGLRARDVTKVIERGASVVWCPGSNLALFDATLHPRRLFEAGKLTIGSDSRLSGSRDLMSELRIAAVHSDLAPADLIGLATVAGSRILRLPDVGGLAPGQRADLIVVRDTGGDPYRSLLGLDRADLRAVVQSGVPAIADRDFAPWFAACDLVSVLVSLDGRPKVLAESRAAPDVIALEPGLALQV